MELVGSYICYHSVDPNTGPAELTKNSGIDPSSRAELDSGRGIYHNRDRTMTQEATLTRALEQILHSVKQAQQPGNDVKRELALIENTVNEALGRKQSRHSGIGRVDI